MLEPWLLEILACPKCKGPITPLGEGGAGGLACFACRVVYPVREGIPIMLVNQALPLPGEHLSARDPDCDPESHPDDERGGR